MDVRLPDGTVVRNVPDGITKEELDALMERNGLGGTPEVEETIEPDQYNFNDDGTVAGINPEWAEFQKGDDLSNVQGTGESLLNGLLLGAGDEVAGPGSSGSAVAAGRRGCRQARP